MSSSPTGSGDRPSRVRTAAAVAGAVLLLAGGCTGAPHHGHGAAPPVHGHALPAAEPGPVPETPVLDLDTAPALQDIIPQLAEKRIVYVGETHNRYDHHLAQLEIIRALHARDARLAIGMEAFQQPFQPVLDDYIAGRLDEQALLRRSEYYARWRFDYRLYAPILRYAREHRLPVIALNLPAELTGKVGREGLDALSESERAQLPGSIDRSDTEYEQRLRLVYQQHPDSGRGFARFLDVQLLWDEGMAQRAADFLEAHPDTRLVVLAGSGHLARGSGIPRRVARRVQASSAIVLNGWEGELSADLADFILLPAARTLPPAGRFGAFLETVDGVPTIDTCMPDSPCLRAGLQPGDRFLSIDGQPIGDMTDLRLAMWDKQPGDTVMLTIARKRWFSAPQEMSYRLELR